MSDAEANAAAEAAEGAVEGAADVVDGAEAPVVPEAEEAEGAEAEAEPEGTEEEMGRIPKAAQERINARIGKITAARKAAEGERDALKAELEPLRDRLAKLADPMVRRAAESAGVLPELLEKGEAERVGKFLEAQRSARFFGDWLEDNADADAELELEGRRYSRSQVRDFKRTHQRTIEEMDDVPGVLSKLRRESSEILKLGLAARREGWKPGGKPVAGAATATGPTKLPRAPKPTGTTAAPAAPPRSAPGGGGRVAEKPDPGAIRDEDDLARAIERGL